MRCGGETGQGWSGLASKKFGKGWIGGSSLFAGYQVENTTQSRHREARLTFYGLSTGKNPLQRKGSRGGDPRGDVGFPADRSPTGGQKKNPVKILTEFLLALGHPLRDGAHCARDQASLAHYSTDVRFCQDPFCPACQPCTGAVKPCALRNPAGLGLDSSGTMPGTGQDPRGSRRRRRWGSQPLACKPRASPEPPAGAAGTGGARGRTHREQSSSPRGPAQRRSREHKSPGGQGRTKAALWAAPAPGAEQAGPEAPKGDGQGGTRRAPRCTRPKAKRSKGNRSEAKSARSAERPGPESSGAERAPAEGASPHKRPSEEAGGNGRGPGRPQRADPRSGCGAAAPDRARAAKRPGRTGEGQRAGRKSRGTMARPAGGHYHCAEGRKARERAGREGPSRAPGARPAAPGDGRKPGRKARAKRRGPQPPSEQGRAGP